MADDKHFVMGDYYRICERTGFKIRANKTRKEWTNRIVREQSFEMRHPQDFVQGVRDDQTVWEPRPRQTDSFQGPLGTTLITTFTPNSIPPWFLGVDSSIRFFINDVLSVMMDNGETFKVTLLDVPNPNLVQIDKSLPFKASSGNVVINLTAESDPVLYLGIGAS